MESILKKIDQKEFRVEIIGLGYVGLTINVFLLFWVITGNQLNLHELI